MKRREALKLGAVMAGVGVLPNCAVPKPVSEMSGSTGPGEFNAMLDEQLGNLEKPGLLDKLVTARTKRELTPEQRARIAEKDAMFRRVLGTVLVTQAFRELPEATRNEQSVQARMWSHFDQIGSSIYELGEMMAALTPDERSRLSTTLKGDSDVAMELGEALDGHAARAGISKARRKSLKKMMAQTAFRLKSGHATTVIDEYVAKVERLSATDERHAQALEMGAQLNEKAFWKQQQRLAQDPPGSPTTPPVTGAPPARPVPVPQQTQVETLTQSARIASRRGDCRSIDVLGKRVFELDPTYYNTIFKVDPEILACTQGFDREAAPPPGRPIPPAWQAQPMTTRRHPGTTGLKVGGYMLGVGFGVLLVAALIAESAEGAALVGLTVGVLMIGIGLVVLLISAIIYAVD
jgi:hypothetical protein